MTESPKPRRNFENAWAQFWANFRFHELSSELKPVMKTHPNASHLYASEQKARSYQNLYLSPPFWRLLSFLQTSPRHSGREHILTAWHFTDSMPLTCTKSDIHFTSRSEAAFRFPRAESRPPSSLYTRHQTRLQEKHIRPHSPQHGTRTGHASPTPTKQTSQRRKFTPRAQKSRHFIKDGHRTQQTQLPPSEL